MKTFGKEKTESKKYDDTIEIGLNNQGQCASKAKNEKEKKNKNKNGRKDGRKIHKYIR